MPLLHRLFGLGRPKPGPRRLDVARLDVPAVDLPAVDLPALPRPQTPLCLIGDLHGRADLLAAMLARISAEPQGPTARLIFVGDLIDRGPQSAAVLQKVWHLTRTRPGQVICLMGNHERMMLDFLSAPTSPAKRWLHAGGAETLASFGVPWISGRDAASRQTALAEALRASLPPGLSDWLAALPLYWQGDGLAVAHADADPTLPLDRQLPATLLWGLGRAAPPRADGIWLAHGHVITPQLQITPGRISLDTGAYRTGRLSALWLDAEGHRVLEVAA